MECSWFQLTLDKDFLYLSNTWHRIPETVIFVYIVRNSNLTYKCSVSCDFTAPMCRGSLPAARLV